MGFDNSVINKRIKNIENKIINGNYDFNAEDIFYIRKVKALRETFLSAASLDDAIWDNPDLVEIVIDFDDTLVNRFKKAMSDVNRGIIDVDSSFYNSLSVKNQLLLKENILLKLKDEDYKLKSLFKVPDDLLHEVVKIIIDTKRYDSFEHFVIPYELYDEKLLDIFMQPYLNNDAYEIPIPGFRNVLDYNFLVEKYGMENFPLQFISFINKDNLSKLDFKVLCKKIKNNPKEFYYVDVSGLYRIFELYSDEEKQELQSLFLENDIIEPFFCKNFFTYDASDISDVNKEEIARKVSKALHRRGDSFQYDFLLNINGNDLKSNENIVSVCIENCNFVELFMANDLDFIKSLEFLKKHEQEIVSAIENYPKKLKSEILYSQQFGAFPNIMKAIIKKDPSLYNLSLFYDQLIKNGSPEDIKEINTFVKNSILERDEKDIVYVPSRIDIIEFLFEHKKVDLLSKLSYIPSGVDFKEYILPLIYKNNYTFFLHKALEKDYFIFYVQPDIMKEVLFKEYFSDVVLNTLINDNFKILGEFYSDKVYDFYREKLSEIYGSELMEKIDLLKICMGAEAIKYLNSNNSKGDTDLGEFVRSQDYETVKKFALLFRDRKFTRQDAEGVYDAIKQRKFKELFPEVVSINHNVIEAINNNDLESTNEYFRIINNYLDESFYNRLESYIKNIMNDNPYYDLSQVVNYEGMEFLNFLKVKIQNSLNDSDRKIYESLLAFTTDYYIVKKRGEYRNTYSMYKDINIPYTYLPKETKAFFAKSFISNKIPVIDSTEFKNNLINDLCDKYDFTPSLVEDLIRYYVGEEVVDNDVDLVRKNLYLFAKELRTRIDDEFEFEDQEMCIKNFLNDESLQKEYFIENINYAEEIFDDFGCEKICDLLNDDIRYELLKEIMDKYMPHKIPSYLYEAYYKIFNIDNIGEHFGSNYCSGFIKYIYDLPLQELRILVEKGIDRFTMFQYASDSVEDDFDRFSKKCAGVENNFLISVDPEPYSTGYDASERKDKYLEYKYLGYKTLETKACPVREIFDTDGKKVLCISGNYTISTPILGEKFGSCVKTFGIGSTLLDRIYEGDSALGMCTTTVVFKDLDTDEDISRANIIFNGNTVYINQSRFSINEKYSNKDVINLDKQFANVLIEQYDDIDNVVIFPGYAMKDASDEGLPVVTLPYNPTSGFGDNVYFDLYEGSKAYLLATTNENKNVLAPVHHYYRENNYPTSRSLIRVREGFDKEAIEKIYYRGKLLEIMGNADEDYVLKSDDITSDNIGEFSDVSDITEVVGIKNDNGTFTIYNDDWFLLVDNGKVYAKVIGYDRKRATKELVEVEKIISESYDRSTLQRDIKQHILEKKDTK